MDRFGAERFSILLSAEAVRRYDGLLGGKTGSGNGDALAPAKYEDGSEDVVEEPGPIDSGLWRGRRIDGSSFCSLAGGNLGFPAARDSFGRRVSHEVSRCGESKDVRLVDCAGPA